MNFLSGGGEMGARMRSFDWSKTPLGPIEGWPHYLQTALSICLNSRFAMPIWWGPERVQLYNDAFIPILGGKHPEALGRPGYEVWPEIWDVIGTQLDSVFATGEATWSTDLLLLLERSGYVEETYFTYSYSPIRDEEGRVQGAFTATSETTPKVISERRLGTLRDLGARAAEGKTAEEACALAAEILAANPYDIPFALIYLLESEQTARLAGAAGLAPGEEASPRIVDLKDEGRRGGWPLADAARSRQARTLIDVVERCGPLPGGPWPDPPHTALVLPLSARDTNSSPAYSSPASARGARSTTTTAASLTWSRDISTAVANARAYEEERRRAEALAELDRAKTLFFSNVSHEFRTPLTLMLGPLEDVLAEPDGGVPPETRERVDVAHRNSLRLLKLVNTLLDFSRIEAGRVQASYEPTDLCKLTVDLASVFRSAVERAGLRLRINCDELPEPVYVDREMWEKVVLNLLSNSFKFTFDGEIEVSLRAVDGAAELTVRDTGIGIPAEEIPHLFERFHRVEGARGRTYEGTGIGLALVQELVRLHGGSVRVESVVGEGSSFIVRVPFGQSHLPPERIRAARTLASTTLSTNTYVEEALRWLPDEADGHPADGSALADIFELPRESQEGRVEGKRPRILLADDNADMRDYIRRLLSARYEVEAVADGEAALTAARARPPDLVLTDIMMPRLDGFGLLKALREDPATSVVPVILLSARAGEESRVEGIEAGADDYLVKPFAARELLARVGTHLDLARARREEEERTAADLRAMRSLYEVGNLCARAGHDFEQCLAEIVATAVAITGADKGNIQLLDAESGALRIAAHRGFAEPFLTFFARVGYEEAASCGAALRSGGRVVVEDVTQSEIFAGQPSLGVLLEAGVRAVQSVPLVSSSGEVLGMISTHFRQPHRPAERELRLMDLLARQTADYLERRRAEEALREQSEVIKQAYDAIFLRDPSNRITLWNKGAERLYGYTQEEARRRNPHELLQTVPPVPLEEIYASLRREGYWEGELRHTRKDDAQLVVETRWATVRDERGETTSILEIVRDVTERKRAEEELREQAEIIETVNRAGQSLAGEIDLHRLVQTVTDAATEISGARFGSFFYNVLDERGESYMLYTLSGVPREAFAHFPMPRNTDIFGPTFRGEGTVLIADVKKDPRYGKNSPYYGMPEGHLPVTSYLAVPVVSRSGEVYGGLFFGHPVEGVFTERAARIVEGLAAQAAVAMDNARLFEAVQRARQEAEQTAAEKERLYREAQEASRLKDEFLATVSHELRTPLTAILGWAAMLRTGQGAGGDAARALETIERNARAQSQLIDDLLDVSRIITGKLRIDVRPVDPNSFIGSAIEAVRPAAEAKGVRVQRIMDTGVVTVSGDPVRLQQVVWNLLSNAIKFTPRGGRVQVRMERVNSHIEIIVSDTGTGISPEFLPHVFDRFRQADMGTTRRHGGMGLGLAIVRHLVELHGGSVRAESPGEGQGSTFTVLLPVAPVYQPAVEGERVHPAARDTMPSFDCAERLDGLRVLVVDDEPDTRELLKAGLGQCGAEVIAAGSAAEALAAISSGAPDLLISDIGMPDEDGYELIRRVRELPADSGGRVPAIALTAYARTEDRLQALRAGYQMHVPKPVEMAELVAVAASLVQRGK